MSRAGLDTVGARSYQSTGLNTAPFIRADAIPWPYRGGLTVNKTNAPSFGLARWTGAVKNALNGTSMSSVERFPSVQLIGKERLATVVHKH